MCIIGNVKPEHHEKVSKRVGKAPKAHICYTVNTITRITYTKATNLSKEKTLILTKYILNRDNQGLN